MRIVGGAARGRRLHAPKGQGIRPTADRVRESLFNVLGQTIEPIEVLDLYAGTGALGLEALSRGAARALFVDSGREAQTLIRGNAETTGFTNRVEVWSMPVDRALERLAREERRFPLVFADPPYGARVGAALIGQVPALLAEGGLLVLEHDKHEFLPAAASDLVKEDERAYGDTRVTFLRARQPLTPTARPDWRS